jgi:hypothetical protein
MPKKKGLSRLLERPDIQPYFDHRVVNNMKFLREKSQINKASAGQVSKEKTEPHAGIVTEDFFFLFLFLFFILPLELSAELTACRKVPKASAETLKTTG